jgi:periplasmic protein CpxP/Spy
MGRMGREGRRSFRMTPDQQLQLLSERLNLTDDQKAKIKPILEDRQKQMEGLRSDTSLSQEDRHTKMRSIMEDFRTKINSVLTDEQRQKFEELGQRRGRDGRMGQPNAGSPPPNI